MGEGKLRLDNGELNPFAKGLMVSEATIGLVKKDGKYALSAEGQVSVVGISGLSLSGPISISYNGFDQLIERRLRSLEQRSRWRLSSLMIRWRLRKKPFMRLKGLRHRSR